MTQTANSFAEVLFQLGIAKEDVADMMGAFRKVPELQKALMNPTITKEKKHRIIDQVFPEGVHNFLKVLCDYDSADEIMDIFSAYEKICDIKEGILRATLYYVTKPSDEQQEKMKTFLCDKYKKNSVELTLIEKPELIGGFILSTEDREFDWSLSGRLSQMKQNLVK